MRCPDKITDNEHDHTAPCANRECRFNLLSMYKKGHPITYTCCHDVVCDHQDGMSNREVGNIFGVSPQAIDIITQRSLKKLKEADHDYNI